MSGSIRNIAVGLLIREGRVLAEEYRETERHPRFLRAIGGGIDFGERAEDAVRREFLEELGVTLTEVRLLAVTENLFALAGKAGHEVVHVFAVRSPELEETAFDARMPILDNTTTAGWFPLSDLGMPFYPDGIVAIAAELADDPASLADPLH